MTPRRTIFRETLLTDLRLLASGETLRHFQTEHPSIDALAVARSSIVDYYTADLLRFGPFVAEFSEPEIAAIEALVTSLKATRSDDHAAMSNLASTCIQQIQ